MRPPLSACRIDQVDIPRARCLEFRPEDCGAAGLTSRRKVEGHRVTGGPRHPVDELVKVEGLAEHGLESRSAAALAHELARLTHCGYIGREHDHGYGTPAGLHPRGIQPGLAEVSGACAIQQHA